MNSQLYEKLGIDGQLEPRKVLDELEEKQFEFLERLETVRDQNRKEELTGLIKQIEDEIRIVKKDMKSVSVSAVSDEKNQSREKTQVTEKIELLKTKNAEKVNEQKKKDAEITAVESKKDRTDSPDEFSQGMSAYNNGQYQKAFEIFKKLSEQENAKAQYYLALLYFDSSGTPKDIDRAIFWFEKAAKGGEIDGYYMHGAALMDNYRGDSNRMKTALESLGIAADHGSEEAMEKFVEAVQSGVGSRKDVKKAIGYCESLCVSTKDSYNKQKYEFTKKELSHLKRNDSEKKINIPWKLIILILIALLVYKFYGEKIRELIDQASKTTVRIEAGISPEGKLEDQSVMIARIFPERGNIRSAASTEAEILLTADKGTEFLMTGNDAEYGGDMWYEIYLDEEQTTVGWVKSSIIEMILLNGEE